MDGKADAKDEETDEDDPTEPMVLAAAGSVRLRTFWPHMKNAAGT